MIDPDKTIGEILSTLDDLGKDIWVESAECEQWGRITVVVARDARSAELLQIALRYVQAITNTNPPQHDHRLN